MSDTSFRIENGVLVSFFGDEETVVIPEGVSVIGDCAITRKQNLKKVVVPEGVKSIGRESFLMNPQLEEVLLPGSLETIGISAFSGCINLKRIEISQPSSLRKINSWAFQYCKELREIVIPPKAVIGTDAFAGCVTLADEDGFLILGGYLYGYFGESEEITVPDSVAVIEQGAFIRKSNLRQVTIPDNVKIIKTGAFDYCFQLTKIYVPDSVVVEDRAFSSCRGLADEAGMLVVNGNLCEYYGESDDIVIPEGVSKISTGVFCQRENIKSVVFPEGLTAIGDSAFGNCTGITSLKLPESLETIGEKAFWNTSLSCIEIPKNTTSIGEKAFDSCSLLKKIIIQGNNTDIAETAFTNCNSIQPDDDGFIIIGKTLYRYLGSNNDVIVPDGITTIGISAFNNRKNITSVKLPDSVTAIKEMAFADCSGLKSIELPHGVKEIETCTFMRCSRLSSILLPATLTKLGSSAFSGCTSIVSVSLPEGCYSIGYRAFYNCRSLREIIIEGVITEVGEAAFIGCDSLITCLVDPALIPETDSKIMASLSWINAPEALKKAAHKEETTKFALSKKKKILPVVFKNDMVLALHTFAENGKITKKNVDDEFLNPAINANATQCTAFLMDWKSGKVSTKDAAKRIEHELSKDPLNATDMKKLWSTQKLKDGTLEITSYKGNDTAITIPNRIGKDVVTRIGDSALSPLKKGRPQAQGEPLTRIVSVEISEGIAEIGREAFSGCSSLVSVSVPESLKRIDYLAFAGCSLLSEINLSDSIEIYNGAFSACKALADTNGFLIIRNALYAYAGREKVLETPNGVKSVQYRAFLDCTDLVSLFLPSSVGNIGAEAFEGCTALEEITIASEHAFVGGNAFHNCKKLKAVYVPKGSTTENYVKQQCKKVKPI